MGDLGVGKRSLVERLKTGAYSENPSWDINEEESLHRV